MKIYCLFAQQKCEYEDQYAPDLRAAIDEWGNSDNPHYLNAEEEKLRKDSSIAFWRCITIDVDDAQFDRLFYPPSDMLKPPSLKKQALTALHAVATGANDTREQHQDLCTIRQALEALPNECPGLEAAPAAQAVYNAVLEICPAPADEIAAAALRAAADQVVPKEPDPDPIQAWSIDDWNHMNITKYQREETRRKLLSIAAELDNSPQPS